MDKETLFQDVRRGEVLLWVGAGFSRYAGYPMGQKTVEVLHESLSANQQQQLDPALPLPRYAEEWVDLHNGRRYELTRVLQRLFTADPASTKYHELLAQIPFLDKIVTTNYDTLFERVYGGRLHKITRGRDIGFGEPQQVEFYKVHGDIENPDSLVVTEEDYRNFFEKQDSLLWKRLETLMAKYTVLFLGYSLEDQNVLALFERLLDQLGPMHRGAYLVAPGFRQTTINRLKRRQVTYLDMTGEAFVDELMANTKANVLPDLTKGLVSADKTSRFLRQLGLTFSYQANDLGLSIQSLGRSHGPTEGKLSFAVRAGSEGRVQLQNLQTGKTLTPARIPVADLAHYRWEVEGVHLPVDDLKTLIIARSPGFNRRVDIYFDGEPGFYGVEVRGYGQGKGNGFLLVGANADTMVKVRAKAMRNRNGTPAGLKGSVTISPRTGGYASVQAGLEVCRLMKIFGRGLGFRVFEDGVLIWQSQSRPGASKFVRSAENLEQLMEDLALVERTFGVVFRHFEYTNSDATQLFDLAETLRKTPVTITKAAPFEVVAEEPLEGEAKEIVEGKGAKWAVIIKDVISKQFAFMGWRFQVDLERAHIIEKPVMKPTGDPSTYFMSSYNNKRTTNILEVTNTLILERGQPGRIKSAEEQLLEEME